MTLQARLPCLWSWTFTEGDVSFRRRRAETTHWVSHMTGANISLQFSFITFLSVVAFLQSAMSTESYSWLPIKHRFSLLPGSSVGGKSMRWSHFRKLKIHDEIRQAWLVANNPGSRTKDTKFPVRTTARKNTEVNGADFSLGGNADPSASGGG